MKFKKQYSRLCQYKYIVMHIPVVVEGYDHCVLRYRKVVITQSLLDHNDVVERKKQIGHHIVVVQH
jgi:hypothetical protein